MESLQSKDQSSKTKPVQQQTQLPPIKTQETETEKAVSQLSRFLQTGLSPDKLAPEQIEELAELVGNQSLISLMTGGGEALPLAGLELSRPTRELPENPITTSRPALIRAADLARKGPLARGAFRKDRLRGQRACGASLQELMGGAI